MSNLKVGDLVSLKSGSDDLTVNAVFGDEVVVVYFHNFKNQFETFKLNKDAVIKIEGETK